MKFKDITDKRYGRLVALKRYGADKYKNVMWECQCDCGRIIIIPGVRLRSGNTKSCGCLSIGLRNKSRKAGNPKNTTGQNLHIWRKAEKTKALLRIKGQINFNFKDKICNDSSGDFQKLWFAVLERTIQDIGLRAKHRNGRDVYDATYYFQKGHKRYEILEEFCEVLDLCPEYVVKVLHETGVLPIPRGHFK